jgi:hypothetical protein
MLRLLAATFVCVAQIACAQEETALADGALLRGLDKVSGAVHDVALRSGKSFEIGNLRVALGECRYPVANPVGDAFAHLVIQNLDINETVFKGWMIASSPALNSLEHARYDVWVLRCAMADTSSE